MDEQTTKMVVLCCCVLSRTFGPGTMHWRGTPISLEEAMLEVVFFWFAFASAVGRQLHSLELVLVLQRSTDRSRILKYAWCDKVTLVSAAGAFEDLACQFFL